MVFRTLLDERELLDYNHSEMGHLSEKVDRLLKPACRHGHRQTEATSQVEEGEWSLRQQVWCVGVRVRVLCLHSWW